MYANKPVIGIVGGIGSGKSHVARLFGELGCLVIDSDEQVRALYESEPVKRELQAWWGREVFDAAGQVDRKAVARKVFSRPEERRRLEQLLHPLVAQARDEQMEQASKDAQVVAYVWDTPLLFEAGLDRDCDAVVFVDAPPAVRAERVRRTRGWDEQELARREKSQMPLDTKKDLSDDVIVNAADAGELSSGDSLRGQVRDVLSRILDQTSRATRDRH